MIVYSWATHGLVTLHELTDSYRVTGPPTSPGSARSARVPLGVNDRDRYSCAPWTTDLHQSTAPFSHAVTHDGLVYTAGIIGQDARTGAVVSEDIAEQCSAMLANLGVLLDGIRVRREDAVRTTVYLTDYDDFAVINGIYGGWFTSPYPARTTLQVAALPLGARVQIDAVFRAPGATGAS